MSIALCNQRGLATLSLFKETSNDHRAERLEIYKMSVEMADRVSQRRQAANSFYLSINTLLVGSSAYLGTTTASVRTTLFISLSGILVSIYWVRAIESYKTLNKAKFSVINKIEEELIIRPYTDEWALLDPDGDGKRHKPFHVTEKFVPKVFIGMYAFQAAALLPWLSVLKIVTSLCR